MNVITLGQRDTDKGFVNLGQFDYIKQLTKIKSDHMKQLPLYLLNICLLWK